MSEQPDSTHIDLGGYSFVDEFVRRIGGATDNNATMRFGMVAAVDNVARTMTVTLDGVSIPGIPIPGGYAPEVGAGVWLLQQGSTLIAIGSTADASGRAGNFVAESVTADAIAAGAITADKITVGGVTGNMMLDGGFEDAALVGMMTLPTGFYRDPSPVATRTGAAGLTAAMPGLPQYNMALLLSNGLSPGGNAPARSVIAASEGDQITVTGWIKAVAGPGASELMGVTGLAFDENGTVIAWDSPGTLYLDPAVYGGGDWTHFAATLTAPAGTVYFGPCLKKYGTGTTGYWCFDDMTVTRSVTGSLIVDGAIDGKTITGALIRTAADGRRVEIGSADYDRVDLFTGESGETPGYLRSYGTGLVLRTAAIPGIKGGALELTQDAAGGEAKLSADDGTVILAGYAFKMFNTSGAGHEYDIPVVKHGIHRFSTTIAAGSSASVAITFDPEFNGTPNVVCSLASAPAGSLYIVPRAINAIASGFSLYIYNLGTASATFTSLDVSWVAAYR